MKKTMSALIVLLLLGVRLNAQTGLFIGPVAQDPKEMLDIMGRVRITDVPTTANPVYVVVRTDTDSVLWKYNINSLATLLTTVSTLYPDITGTGYIAIAGVVNPSPPVSFFRSKLDKFIASSLNGAPIFSFMSDSFPIQQRDATLDWSISYLPDFYIRGGVVSIGEYLYVAMRYQGTNERRIYRYNRASLSVGGVMMNFSGKQLLDAGEPLMTSNGQDFFFSYDAGNGPDNVIAKFRLNGTTFEYISSAIIGSPGDFTQSYLVDSTMNYYGLSDNNQTLKKFSPSGSLVWQNFSLIQVLMNWSDHLYGSRGVQSVIYEKINK